MNTKAKVIAAQSKPMPDWLKKMGKKGIEKYFKENPNSIYNPNRQSKSLNKKYTNPSIKNKPSDASNILKESLKLEPSKTVVNKLSNIDKDTVQNLISVAKRPNPRNFEKHVSVALNAAMKDQDKNQIENAFKKSHKNPDDKESRGIVDKFLRRAFKASLATTIGTGAATIGYTALMSNVGWHSAQAAAIGVAAIGTGIAATYAAAAVTGTVAVSYLLYKGIRAAYRKFTKNKETASLLTYFNESSKKKVQSGVVGDYFSKYSKNRKTNKLAQKIRSIGSKSQNRLRKEIESYAKQVSKELQKSKENHEITLDPKLVRAEARSAFFNLIDSELDKYFGLNAVTSSHDVKSDMSEDPEHEKLDNFIRKLLDNHIDYLDKIGEDLEHLVEEIKIAIERYKGEVPQSKPLVIQTTVKRVLDEILDKKLEDFFAKGNENSGYQKNDDLAEDYA